MGRRGVAPILQQFVRRKPDMFTDTAVARALWGALLLLIAIGVWAWWGLVVAFLQG
jgi:hypothetical protein